MTGYVPFGPGKRYWWEQNRKTRTGSRRSKSRKHAHLKVHVHGPNFEHVTHHNAPKGPLG